MRNGLLATDFRFLFIFCSSLSYGVPAGYQQMNVAVFLFSILYIRRIQGFRSASFLPNPASVFFIVTHKIVRRNTWSYLKCDIEYEKNDIEIIFSLKIRVCAGIMLLEQVRMQMTENCNTLTINEDFADALSVSRILKLGDCALQLKRFQIFDNEFWDDLTEHVHPFFELFVILNGALNYSVENHYGQLDSSNNILLVPPGTPHNRNMISQDERVIIIQFGMMSAGAPGAAVPEDLRNELSKRHYKLENVSLNDFESILKLCMEHRPLWRECLLNRLEKFLLDFFVSHLGALFSENGLLKKHAAPHGARLRRLEQLVEITLDARLRLDDYASRLGISGRQIERMVSAHYGMTFGRYIMSRRVEAARKMLGSSFLSVKSVANALGYDDFSHFCRVFKNATGVSPGKYAERVRAGLNQNAEANRPPVNSGPVH